ncbi:anti-sigma factor domain-containing protein [Cryobacterium fucosi]|uniref:Anti-sigma factor n=1 Tax=Cryobacterium fucosi TaxID=1259157 RepID=A0A4R9B4J2_9MICO|nr:anti-sigma factor [Cryobacterium fucosi]TFD75931.1 anti-sigma factor [Cryobacterium fucosi]
MTHIDRDDLALIALAELDLTEPERVHLSECPECSLDLISLRHTIAVGRSARDVEVIEPGDAVWGRIHSALGLSDAVAGTPRRSDYPAAVGPARAGPARVGPVARIDGSARPGRARFWLPLTVAAGIVGLVGGIGGGIWWESLRQDAAPPVVTEAKIAEAKLDPFPGWDAAGTAYVEKAADGRREVVVDLTGATGTAPLREVWLIKADASGLVSIGLLDGNTGRFSIPDGLDLAQYPLVDVSAEPDNGDPAHSGDSIVRGRLHAT